MKSRIFKFVLYVAVTLAMYCSTAHAAINVTAIGLVPDGVTDNSPVWQAYVNAVQPTHWGPASANFYFPPGQYLLKAGINLNNLNPFSLVGDLDANGNPLATIICPTANTVCVNCRVNGGAFQIRQMAITASAVGGTAILNGCTLSQIIEDCVITGYNGLGNNIAVGPTPFGGAMRRCQIVGIPSVLPWPTGQSGAGIGILHYGALIADTTITGFKTGCITAGECSMSRCTFNNCGTGLISGADSNGANDVAQICAMCDLTFNTCQTCYIPQVVGNSFLNNFVMNGAAPGATQTPKYAMQVGVMGTAVVRNMKYNGTFITPFSWNAKSQSGNGVTLVDNPGPRALPNTFDDVTLPVFDPANRIDVTTKGIASSTPSTPVDQYAAIQALINSSPNGTSLYFPAAVGGGGYYVSHSLVIPDRSYLKICGDGCAAGGGGDGSTIGPVAGSPAFALINAAYPTSGTFQIDDLNLNANGTAVYATNASTSSIRRCQISGTTCLDMRSCNRCSLQSAYLNPSVLGIQVYGGANNTLEEWTINIRNTEGLRAGDTKSLQVYCARQEAVHNAFNLGIAPDGSPAPIYDCAFMGIEMEANDYFFTMANCQNCFVAATYCHGTSGIVDHRE